MDIVVINAGPTPNSWDMVYYALFSINGVVYKCEWASAEHAQLYKRTTKRVRTAFKDSAAVMCWRKHRATPAFIAEIKVAVGFI